MTYVLIPGAGGAAWYWSRVEAEFRRRGREAIAVDLPADDDRSGLADYADCVVEAIGDRTGIVLVAQSLGGFTVPLVCARAPVSLLVLVNAMIPLPGESAGAWWENTGQRQAMAANDARQGRAVGAAPSDEEFDAETYFLHDLPADVVAESAAHVRDQSGTPFELPLPLEAWPDVPTRVVTARDDRFFPADFQRRVAEDRLGITPVEIPGGHLVALSQPAALVVQLEAFRAELPGADG